MKEQRPEGEREIEAYKIKIDHNLSSRSVRPKFKYRASRGQ